jgi:thiamine biosynthesis protein ThiC
MFREQTRAFTFNGRIKIMANYDVSFIIAQGLRSESIANACMEDL